MGKRQVAPVKPGEMLEEGKKRSSSRRGLTK
jgi:hypothetical protein